MKSAQLKLGRTFGVTFGHGKDFFDELSEFCAKNNVRQGYIPMFIGALTDIEAVGTHEKLESPEKPMITGGHRISLANAEAVGCGTIAFDSKTGKISPHIHVSMGLRTSGGTSHTTHLLSARVQFLIEMTVVEVVAPDMERVEDSEVFGLGILEYSPRKFNN